jgi:hypothetical protein
MAHGANYYFGQYPRLQPTRNRRQHVPMPSPDFVYALWVSSTPGISHPDLKFQPFANELTVSERFLYTSIANGYCGTHSRQPADPDPGSNLELNPIDVALTALGDAAAPVDDVRGALGRSFKLICDANVKNR